MTDTDELRERVMDLLDDASAIIDDRSIEDRVHDFALSEYRRGRRDALAAVQAELVRLKHFEVPNDTGVDAQRAWQQALSRATAAVIQARAGEVGS